MRYSDWEYYTKRVRGWLQDTNKQFPAAQQLRRKCHERREQNRSNGDERKVIHSGRGTLQ